MTDWADDKITAFMSNEADRCALRIVNALDRGSLPTGNSDVESAIKRAIHRVEARADAAEQMVAELRAVLVKRHHHDVAGGICDTPERCSCDDDVTAILEAVAPIAADAAAAREWALGVQVVAQAARLKLAEAVVSAARALVSRTVGLGPCLADYVAVHHALAAWDAVPVDVAPVDLG